MGEMVRRGQGEGELEGGKGRGKEGGKGEGGMGELMRVESQQTHTKRAACIHSFFLSLSLPPAFRCGWASVGGSADVVPCDVWA